MKLGELIFSQAALGRLNQMPLRAKTSLKVKRIVSRASSELESYEKVRTELLDKYGVKNEEKGEYEFKEPGSKEAFDKDFEELMESEVDLKFEKLMFSEIENETIASADLFALSWVISGMEEDEAKPENPAQ
jgi:hypothetical protein